MSVAFLIAVSRFGSWVVLVVSPIHLYYKKSNHFIIEVACHSEKFDSHLVIPTHYVVEVEVQAAPMIVKFNPFNICMFDGGHS